LSARVTLETLEIEKSIRLIFINSKKKGRDQAGCLSEMQPFWGIASAVLSPLTHLHSLKEQKMPLFNHHNMMKG